MFRLYNLIQRIVITLNASYTTETGIGTNRRTNRMQYTMKKAENMPEESVPNKKKKFLLTQKIRKNFVFANKQI